MPGGVLPHIGRGFELVDEHFCGSQSNVIRNSTPDEEIVTCKSTSASSESYTRKLLGPC